MKNNKPTNKESIFNAGSLYRQSRRALTLFAILFMGAFVFSCEQFDDVEEIVDEIEEEQSVKMFKADLHPLNNSGVKGTALFKYNRGGQFISEVNARGLVPGKNHPQHIHFKAECPPASAAGADGLLTIGDGLPFYGEVFVPLDDQLVPFNSDNFPTANPSGEITYIETVGLNLLIAAIDDAYSGAQSLKDLNLGKRTVVLHGAFVKDNKIVPEGTEGAKYIASLPVACGTIEEVMHE